MPQLAQKWRERYPGAYDHIDDETLENEIIKKFPGAYDHLRTPKQETLPQAPGTVQEVSLDKKLPVSFPSPFGIGNQDFRQHSVVEKPSWPQQKVLPKPTGTIGPTPPKFLGGVFEPPVAVTQFFNDLANKITDPNVTGPISRALPGLGGPGVSEQFVPQVAGFVAGALQGAGQQLNPGNLALTAMGGGEIAAMRQFNTLYKMGKLAEAAPYLKLAKGLETGTKIASVPVGLHGAGEVAQGAYNFDPARVGGGLFELAGAGLGLRSRVNPLMEEIHARPQEVSTPQAGDINLAPDAAGNFTSQMLGDQLLRPEVLAPETPKPRMHINDILNTPVGKIIDDLGIDLGGIAGPRVEGFRQEGGPQQQPNFFDVRPDEARAKIEAARAAAREEVDAGFIPQAPTPVEQSPAGIGAIIVKQDVPQTINRLMAEGYKIESITPEGYPRMVKGEMTPTIEPDPMEPAFSRAYDDDLFKGSEGKGLGKDSFEKQWQQSIKEAQILGIDYKAYDNLDDLQWHITKKVAQETIRTGKNPLAEFVEPDPNDPQFARAKKGGITIGADIRRSAGELTTGYSGQLPGIMMREAMQNAIDAVRSKGEHGDIRVLADPETKTFEIQDNGKGMTMEELETVFSDLHSSGKTTDTGATGGKGVGKASYMLGGQHFHVTTIAEHNGQIIKTVMEGTPDQFLDPVEGVTPIQEVMPPGTPTGTTIRTKLGPDQETWALNDTFRNIERYSRNIPAKLRSSLYGVETYGLNKGKPKYMDNPWKQTTNPPHEVAKVDFGNADVTLFLDPKRDTATRTGMNVQVLNNGMWQFSMWHNLKEETPGVPDEVIVDVAPKVEEGTSEYPFPVQRESMKDDFKQAVRDLIDEKIVNPFASRKKSKLKEIYENLTPIPLSAPKTPPASGVSKNGIRFTFGKPKPKPRFREAVIFDPGDRLTKEEKTAFINNPSTQAFVDIVDEQLEQILQNLKDPALISKLEKIGLVLDPNMHGVHIPNPTSPRDAPKSMILINPFIAIDKHTNPYNAAIENVVTINHEAAHVGVDVSSKFTAINPNDMMDPRVGEFLQTYMREVVEATGNDSGHGVGFIKRLGQVYAAQGPDRGLQFVDALTALYETERDGFRQHGGYSRDIQELLQVYTESRGRDAVTEDFLSGTGIKSAATQGGKGGVSGANKGSTGGINRVALKNDTKETRKGLLAAGYTSTGRSTKEGFPIWVKEAPRDTSLAGRALEYWNAPRGAMSVDLPFLSSAGFRQGLTSLAVNPVGWAKAWGDSVRAYGAEHTFHKVMNDISRLPIFQEREGPRGAKLPSIGEEMGIELTDLGNLKSREEHVRGNLAERIPVYGRHVRASNRAFTAYVNSLRASTGTLMFDQYRQDQAMKAMQAQLKGEQVKDEPKTLDQNLPLAKQVGKAIMTLTGRGPTHVEGPIISGEPHNIELSRAMGFLSNVYFSPRLNSARMALFNPFTYANADPMVRKMYVKGLLGAIAAWWGIASLGELIGAEVNKDPNNSDFGKIRFGTVRIDAGGGLQQPIVLFSRVRPSWFKNPVPVPFPPYGEMIQDPGGGRWTSSSSGRSFPFGQGYKPENEWSKFIEFNENKLHPNLKFAVDFFKRSDDRPFYPIDRTLQLAAPMLANDLYETFQENPWLVPIVSGTSSIGMGGSTYDRGEPKPQLTPLLDAIGIPVSEFDPKLGGR